MDGVKNFKTKSKIKVMLLALVLLCLVTFGSYAVWYYGFDGGSNTISTNDISIDFLEGNEVIGLTSALPISDNDGKNLNDTFDFVVTTDTIRELGINYTLSIEKLSAAEGFTNLNDSDVKVYLEDYEGNVLVEPTLISDLDNFVLYSDTNTHNSSTRTLKDKYKLRVWIDGDVSTNDWDENTHNQYNFKINISSSETTAVPDGMYMVNTIVQNGTITGDTSKMVARTDNVSFNLTPTTTGEVGYANCTNDQIGKIDDNGLLTVENITANTICTVDFSTQMTTLYTDGTLIINEHASNRTANIIEHGAVTNTYNPMSETESYVWSSVSNQLWASQRNNISNVEIGRNIKPTSTAYWFYELKNMTTGNFIYLNTSNVITMNNMFYEAGYNVTTFDIGDLSSWDTSSVVDMSWMFESAGYGATTFDIGDLSSWDTSSVTDMSGTFDNAGYNATTFDIGDLSSWDTSQAIYMYKMFGWSGYNATTWNIGDLSDWDISNATEIWSMFYGAGKNALLWNVGDLSNWNTSNVTDMECMFAEAGYSATTFDIGDLSSWDTSNVLYMSEMFSSAGYNATTFNSIGTLQIPAGCYLDEFVYNTPNFTGNFILVGNYENVYGMFQNSVTNNNARVNIYYTDSDSQIVAENMVSLYGPSGSESQGNIYTQSDGMYTVNVVVLNGAITGNTSSRILPNENATFQLSPNDPDAVTIISCTNDQSATFLNNALTVSNVSSSTTCTVGFYGKTTSLHEDGTLIINELAEDVSSNIIEHGNITNTYDAMSVSNAYVFTINRNQGGSVNTPWYNERSNIKNVKIGESIQPTSTSGWFFNTNNLETVNFTNLNTSSVTDMSFMFYKAGYSVTSLDIDLSNLNTSSVSDMSYMLEFVGYSATSLDIDLSNLNTSSVTDMSFMLGGIGAQATTWNIGDLSNWDTSNVINMSYMLSGAGARATTWDIGNLSNWDTSSVTDMSAMFSETGEFATTFNSIGTLSIPTNCNVSAFAYNSLKLISDITFEGVPSNYEYIFYQTATNANARVNLHYVDADTRTFVNDMIGLYGPSGSESQGQIYKVDSEIIVPAVSMSSYVQDNLVTSGDGIAYSSDRNKYYYQGSNVNNYISIGGDLFRILSFESDNTMQIYQDVKYGGIAFDASGNRTTANNPYCTSASTFISGSTTIYSGCNAWSPFDNFSNGTVTDIVSEDSTLKTYLNTTVYDGLNSTIKSLIVEHDFYVGPVGGLSGDGKNTTYNQQDDFIWHGKIGTFNAGDVRYSGEGNMNFESTISSYIFAPLTSNDALWTMNGSRTNTLDVMLIMNNKVTKRRASRADYSPVIYYTKPVMYISSNINVTGTGTSGDPFIIQN